jgi:hypothetical protein
VDDEWVRDTKATKGAVYRLREPIDDDPYGIPEDDPEDDS